jgi:hypothetical protein
MCDLKTAYHEAGHVVLARITGVYVVDDDIVISRVSRAVAPLIREAKLCQARASLLGQMTSRMYKWEEAIIAAAGSQAELLFQQRLCYVVSESSLSLGAHGDMIQVRDLFGPGYWFSFCDRAMLYLLRPPIWKLVSDLADLIIDAQGVLAKDAANNFLSAQIKALGLPDMQILK